MSSHNFEILFLGDSGVGKTTLIEYIKTGGYDPDTVPTLGIPMHRVPKKINGADVIFTLYDTQNMEGVVPPSAYRRAHAIFMVYDITRKDSLDKLQGTYLDGVRNYAPDDVHLILIGNKIDKEQQHRQVTFEAANHVAEQMELTSFMEVSAKSGANVMDILRQVGARLIEQQQFYKIAVIGDRAVGKTTYVYSLCGKSDAERNAIKRTVSARVYKTSVSVNGKTVKCEIDDWPGDKHAFISRRERYHGIVLVYDHSKQESLTNIQDVWLPLVHGDNCVIVANKVQDVATFSPPTDMQNRRIVAVDIFRRIHIEDPIQQLITSAIANASETLITLGDMGEREQSLDSGGASCC